MSRNRELRRGFTLVELLVVITIIGMLMALLLPAVNAAVEQARQAYCKNNMRQLATAAIGFEAAKHRFPGYSEKVGPTTGSWILAIMPQLERHDIYDEWGAIANSPPYLELLICPSDPPEQTVGPVNAYVINAGRYNDGSTSEATVANGLSHNYASNGIKTSIDDVISADGTSTTILISENVQARKNGRGWHVPGNATSSGDTGTKVVFVWYDAETPNRRINGNKLAPSPNTNELNDMRRPSSFHNGGVNAVFCDMHVIFLREDIDYWVYQQLMTPRGSESDLPATAKSYVLNGADYQ